MKEKILVIGLPRSGTTILSNSINSLDNAFCFIEPHLEYTAKKKLSFNDKKLRWLFNLHYHPNDALPLDHTISKILRKYDIVGFKETFRSNVYNPIKKNFSNEDILKKYKAVGYKIIPIVRNPLDVWNSNKRFSPENTSWNIWLKLFINNCYEYYKFINNSNPIIFEKFIKNPTDTLNNFGLNFRGDIIIKPRNIRMGDYEAKNSTKIDYKPKPILYTKEEKEIIIKSEALKIYKKIYEKN